MSLIIFLIVASDMDNENFLATLPYDLREEVLLTSD
jgi:hypothetical protein